MAAGGLEAGADSVGVAEGRAAVEPGDRGEVAMFLTRRSVRKLIDVDRIRQAIEAAEQKTSGEIRVSVAPWFWGNVERAADRAFSRLGMTQTRERNGVLLFVVPSRRSFVVRGDTGIHAKVGQAF